MILLEIDVIINIILILEIGEYIVMIYFGEDMIYYNYYLVEKGSYVFVVGD